MTVKGIINFYKDLPEPDRTNGILRALQQHHLLSREQAIEQLKKATESDDDVTWITVKGNHIPIKDGEDKGDAVKNFFDKKNNDKPTKDSTVGTIPKKKRTTYSKAKKRFSKIETTRENFSYVPYLDRAFDATVKEEALEFYKEFGNGTDPLYVIGHTENEGDGLGEREQRTYKELQKDHIPLIGKWVDPEDGKIYRDISIAYANMTRDEALKRKNDLNQISIMIVYENGEHKFVY